MTSPPRRNP